MLYEALNMLAVLPAQTIKNSAYHSYEQAIRKNLREDLIRRLVEEMSPVVDLAAKTVLLKHDFIITNFNTIKLMEGMA